MNKPYCKIVIDISYDYDNKLYYGEYKKAALSGRSFDTKLDYDEWCKCTGFTSRSVEDLVSMISDDMNERKFR